MRAPSCWARIYFMVLAALILSACQAPPSANQAASSAATTPIAPNRTLVLAGQSKTGSLAAKGLTNVGLTGIGVTPFNAGLVLQSPNESVASQLAVSLPQLNTDSWRTLPDGRMETTYVLKPALTWQDGTPLSSEDFVFANRVYATPAYGITAAGPPVNLIESIDASDPLTIVILWKRPYADAGIITADRLQALPRQILQDPFERLSADAFAAHPFWSTDYLGLGAYRLTRWELGSFLEAEAFDSYVGGRARIDRIKILFFTDTNTALANILAGEVHAVAGHNVLTYEQSASLQREWETTRAGSVLFVPGGIRRIENQFRPEIANPSYIMDLRVRRGIAHAIDRPGLNDALFGGHGFVADSLVSPALSYYPEIDRVIMKYPYDTRRSEQLMNEAGLFKSLDGYYADPATGARLNWEMKVLSNTQNETALHIQADTWRRAGFEMTETVFPATQIDDREARAKFRSMFFTGGGTLETVGGSGIPTPENRWTGSNRGAWANAEYDRLLAAWSSALDPRERRGHLVEMAKLYSQELGSTPVFFEPYPSPYVASLKGIVDADMFDLEHWEWIS